FPAILTLSNVFVNLPRVEYSEYHFSPIMFFSYVQSRLLPIVLILSVYRGIIFDIQLLKNFQEKGLVMPKLEYSKIKYVQSYETNIPIYNLLRFSVWYHGTDQVG